MVLFEMQVNGQLVLKRDKFRFLGIGFGGNFLLYYCKFLLREIYGFLVAQNKIVIENFQNILLLNTFLKITKKIQDILKQMIKVFSNCQDIDSFYYFDTYFNSKIESQENQNLNFKKNPIKNQDRITIIKGILESVDFLYKIDEIKIPII